eukprot:4700944-Lingulodinium_polyedra.AAC.1
MLRGCCVNADRLLLACCLNARTLRMLFDAVSWLLCGNCWGTVVLLFGGCGMANAQLFDGRVMSARILYECCLNALDAARIAR